jgi:DNA replication and repair protein RecF
VNAIAPSERVDAPTRATGRRIAVERLILTDFRCFSHLRLEPTPAPVVLTGGNGAGKTTILEALSFLAPGRGLRRVRLDEILRRSPESPPAAQWAVAARLGRADGPCDVGTGIDARGGPTGRERRTIRVDGRPMRSQAALAEVAGVVWLTPEMDRLFLEGASARRRFLDRLIFNVDPAHADRVGAYEHALRERARLLRQGPADRTWLGGLEDTMARQGIAIAAARRRIAARLAALCADEPPPFCGADPSVDGAVDRWLDDAPEAACEERLRAALAASRRLDAETGGAAAGPHRSDLTVHHRPSGRPAAACSTGEQKTLLIALVMAGARLQAAERGALPLVLLDEIAAHLDARRRGALFQLLADLGAQTWCSGSDPELFRGLDGRAQVYIIRDGTAEVVVRP